MNAAIQTQFPNTKVNGTQTEPIFIQIDKGQCATITEAAAQIENVHFCNVAIQTEAISSNSAATQTESLIVHNKRMQTLSIPSHDKSIQTTGPQPHNKNTQIDIQAKDVLIGIDPSITNLQENLA